MFSSPFLIDYTKPVSGVVVDGTDFQEDILWFGNPHQIQGRNKEKLIVIIFCNSVIFIFYQFKTKVHIILIFYMSPNRYSYLGILRENFFIFLGTFLHFPNPTLQAESCPNQIIAIKNPQWKVLNRLGMLDSEGELWKIKYDKKYVIPAAVEDTVDVKLVLTKDATNQDIMGAGALYRKAELYNGGVYKVNKNPWRMGHIPITIPCSFV